MKEARERQLRRRLLGAAGVAVAAAIALAIYASTLGGSNPSVRSAPIGPGGVPLCRSSQLSTVPIGFGLVPGENWDVGGLDIENVGHSSCSLPGKPRVAVYSGGARLPVRHLPGDNASVPNSRGTIVHVLAPGERAYVVFRWSNWCGPQKIRGQATLRYSFGDGLVLSQGNNAPTCTAPGSPSRLRVAGPLASS